MGSLASGTGTATFRQPNFLDLAGNATGAQMLALPSGDLYVGTGGGIAAAVAMSGDATITNAGVVTVANSAVIGKVLTGFSAGAGVVSATDSILQAFQKIVGNISAIVSPTFKTKTTTYTAVAGDIVVADATSGAFTVTLPAASSNANALITIKKIDASANAVTVGHSGGDTIDGATSVSLPSQWDAAQFGSNGTVWYVTN